MVSSKLEKFAKISIPDVYIRYHMDSRRDNEIFAEEKIFTIFGLGDLGAVLHTVAMIFFSLMLWIRFYYSRRSGKLMIEMK